MKQFGKEPADMLPIGFAMFLLFPFIIMAALIAGPPLVIVREVAEVFGKNIKWLDWLPRLTPKQTKDGEG